MREIQIFMHEEPEGWWAESPQMPGWSAAAETAEELQALAAEGVEFEGLAPANLVFVVERETVSPTIVFDFVSRTAGVAGRDYGVTTRLQKARRESEARFKAFAGGAPPLSGTA